MCGNEGPSRLCVSRDKPRVMFARYINSAIFTLKFAVHMSRVLTNKEISQIYYWQRTVWQRSIRVSSIISAISKLFRCISRNLQNPLATMCRVPRSPKSRLYAKGIIQYTCAFIVKIFERVTYSRQQTELSILDFGPFRRMVRIT